MQLIGRTVLSSHNFNKWYGNNIESSFYDTYLGALWKKSKEEKIGNQKIELFLETVILNDKYENSKPVLRWICRMGCFSSFAKHYIC